MTATDSRIHPVTIALARHAAQIHEDYESVMERRLDEKTGEFDPLKLPDDRPCIAAGSALD